MSKQDLMENNSIGNKRILIGNISLIALVVLLTVLLWNEYSLYEAVAPVGTLISLVFLAVTLICYVPVKEAVRDPYFYMVAACSVIAMINLFIVGSNKGAWLTATDVVIVAYLSGKVRLSRTLVWFSCIYTGFFFFYWTFDVKGYFKGYNTNYGGLVLITGFVFAITGLVAFWKILKKSDKKGAAFLAGFIVFCFAWAYNIIAWYRARCALLGLVVFAILMVIPKKIWKNKVFYTLLTLASTIGAIVVSLLYVWLGKYSDIFSIRVFYKDIISGRDTIWTDLWTAFIAKPLTGIGSSYKINVEWMEGMFEVHNGLLDILVVHGIIVFAITVFLLIRGLLSYREKAGTDMISKTAMAGTFAILAASFMENFFIVPPFLPATLVLIAIAGSV